MSFVSLWEGARSSHLYLTPHLYHLLISFVSVFSVLWKSRPANTFEAAEGVLPSSHTRCSGPGLLGMVADSPPGKKPSNPGRALEASRGNLAALGRALRCQACHGPANHIAGTNYSPKNTGLLRAMDQVMGLPPPSRVPNALPQGLRRG